MQWDEIAVLSVTTLSSIGMLIIATAGLAVIFGLMKVINFAHGEFIMAGAYVTVIAEHAGVPLLFAVLLATAVMALFGMAVEWLIIRWLYGRLLDSLLATWGLSLVMVQVATILAGPFGRALRMPFGTARIGSGSVSEYSVFLIAVAGFMVVVTYIILTRTNYGLRAQAAVQVPDMASAIGINTKVTNRLTFALGSGLAGMAGGVLVPVYSVTPAVGGAFIAKSFLTVISAGPVALSGSVVSGSMIEGVHRVAAYFYGGVRGLIILLIFAVVLLRIFRNGVSASWLRRI